MMYTDLLGVRFRPHGRNKQEGFDCLGIAIEVLKRNGINCPDVYYDTLKQGDSVWEDFNSHFTKIDKPEVNCIIELASMTQKRGHIAVYIGEGLIIHSIVNVGVSIEPLSHYEKKIEGYYRVNN